MTPGHGLHLDQASWQRVRVLSAREFKVLLTLFSMADTADSEVKISIAHLGREAGLSYRLTHNAIRSLAQRQFLTYRPARNQWEESLFTLAPTRVSSQNEEAGEEATDATAAIAEAGVKAEGPRLAKNGLLHHHPIDISKENISRIDNRIGDRFTPTTEAEVLALDIATAFDDRKGLGLYLAYCRKYPEPLVRKAFADVKEVPREKIKKSRGALFTYLVQKYAGDSSATN